MLEQLKVKCSNFIAVIPTNTYLYSSRDDSITPFFGLRLPTFLARVFENSLRENFRKIYSLSRDQQPIGKIQIRIDAFSFWFLTTLVTRNDERYAVTLGPLVVERISSVELRYAMHKMKIGSDNGAILESFMGVVPSFHREILPHLAGVLQDCMESSLQEPEILIEDQTAITTEECDVSEEKFVTLDYVEENYAAEARILSAIEHGDVEFLRTAMPRNISSFNMPPRYPNDPLREIKNLSITLNSISLRSAIRGGLSQSLAHSMSHTFAIRIEQQTNATSLRELDYEIVTEFAKAVRDYALKNHSDLIVKTVNYVRRNLASPLSLSQVSKELAVSCEHLCRQFANEMGMTLTEFIHKTKIQESCDLLASHRYTINDIALTFGYSSPSHYTKMFERYMGTPPKRWQLKAIGNSPGKIILV